MFRIRSFHLSLPFWSLSPFPFFTWCTPASLLPSSLPLPYPSSQIYMHNLDSDPGFPFVRTSIRHFGHSAGRRQQRGLGAQFSQFNHVMWCRRLQRYRKLVMYRRVVNGAHISGIWLPVLGDQNPVQGYTLYKWRSWKHWNHTHFHKCFRIT